MDSANITFYEKYKNAGRSPELIFVVGLRATLSLMGLTMNFLLVWITIRSKSLRSICNILIALDSGSIAMYLLINVVGFSNVLSGVNFISSKLCCFVIEPIPLFGLNFNTSIMLFIAIDRFFSVFKPIWHTKRRKSTYIFCFVLICLAYSAFMLQFYLSNVNPANPVMCSLASDCMQNGTSSQHSTNVLIINGLTVVFYLGIWLLLKFRSHNTSTISKNAVEYTRKIFKSLAVLVSFYFAGYLINSVIRLSYQTMGLTPVQISFFSNYLTIFSILTQSINAPTLYIFSTEYRKAFKKFFGWNNSSN